MIDGFAQAFGACLRAIGWVVWALWGKVNAASNVARAGCGWAQGCCADVWEAGALV